MMDKAKLRKKNVFYPKRQRFPILAIARHLIKQHPCAKAQSKPGNRKLFAADT
ncbi:hypothetical protein [Dechloromonas sp. CZR5]|uniref:hypothetical protein n=1 Tax=Dechloromonas sp. CZR5 TaxID=2608630 RepID=UPI00168AAA39|nr:hypothetical protein [Dechloromonas sp. CZR5]